MSFLDYLRNLPVNTTIAVYLGDELYRIDKAGTFCGDEFQNLRSMTIAAYRPAEGSGIGVSKVFLMPATE